MAFYGFKGLGWFGCGVVVALGSYLATSQGALERARLAHVESQIADAHKDIRDLETEFDTRANLVQLGQWNGTVLKLAAPAAQQFVASETALAQIDSAPAPTQVAAVVPAAAPVPEPAVATRGDADAKSGPQGTAQADGLGKARNQAVAMVDKSLLSAATINDLERRAQAEQSALR